jgi:hypothetical protein
VSIKGVSVTGRNGGHAHQGVLAVTKSANELDVAARHSTEIGAVVLSDEQVPTHDRLT